MIEQPSPPQPRCATRRRWQRGALWAALCTGLGVAVWPMGQAAYGWWSQRELRQDWQREWQAEVAQEKAEAAQDKAFARAHKGHKYLSRSRSRWARSTKKLPPTRIIIPSIDLDAIVVSGVSEGSLRRGPGHDPRSSLPGQSGNCVIAAHRNAYGWWFYGLNKLSTNASIQLKTPRGSYFYALASTRVLPDTATWALSPPPRGSAPRLTLYTCALPHGAHRIVVTARLIRTEPAS